MRNIRKAYLLGGGIGSLSAAFYMIQDCHVNPTDITIFESYEVTGGALDASGDLSHGFISRGSRMLNYPIYENLWDLMKQIPSLDHPGQTLYDETIQFNKDFPTHSHCRLVDRNQKRMDVENLHFTMKDRMDLLTLLLTPEDKLGAKPIYECFDSHFFTTNFWYMWQTTFAFQTWHSAAELRRYCLRFQHEFRHVDTLEGVVHTVYNQYDSLVLPLEDFLRKKGVHFSFGSVCNDITLEVSAPGADGIQRKTVTGFDFIEKHGDKKHIAVAPDDLVIVQNGSMTDAGSYGTNTEPVQLKSREQISETATSWKLWERLAAQVSDNSFGRPEVFTRCIQESLWYSYTVTVPNAYRPGGFVEQFVKYSKSEPGCGGLITFRDSNWLLGAVVPTQPHFRGQPDGSCVFWGYSLFPWRVGNFVNKPMIECTGLEIMEELRNSMGMEVGTFDGALCRTACLPFITAQFMTRVRSDRPLPVPKGCTNLGMTSQFVEIPDDCVFTVEYSVRAARMAVYELLNCKDHTVCPINHLERSPLTQVRCVKKAFKGTAYETVTQVTLGMGIAAALVYCGMNACKYVKKVGGVKAFFGKIK